MSLKSQEEVYFSSISIVLLYIESNIWLTNFNITYKHRRRGMKKRKRQTDRQMDGRTDESEILFELERK